MSVKAEKRAKIEELVQSTFPERVWEPTGVDGEGRTLWSSRAATEADRKRRRAWVRAHLHTY